MTYLICTTKLVGVCTSQMISVVLVLLDLRERREADVHSAHAHPRYHGNAICSSLNINHSDKSSLFNQRFAIERSTPTLRCEYFTRPPQLLKLMMICDCAVITMVCNSAKFSPMHLECHSKLSQKLVYWITKKTLSHSHHKKTIHNDSPHSTSISFSLLSAFFVDPSIELQKKLSFSSKECPQRSTPPPVFLSFNLLLPSLRLTTVSSKTYTTTTPHSASISFNLLNYKEKKRSCQEFAHNAPCLESMSFNRSGAFLKSLRPLNYLQNGCRSSSKECPQCVFPQSLNRPPFP